MERLQSANTGKERLEQLIQLWGSYIPEIYGVCKALMMSKDNDEAAAAAWSDVMGCLYDECDQIVQTLSKEKRLASRWRNK